MEFLKSIIEKKEITFSKSDSKIIDYLIRNENELLYLTSSDISKDLSISHSTLSRFWSKIGFNNIKEFKTALSDYCTPTPYSKVEKTLSTLKNDNNIIHNIIKRDVYTMEKTLELINESEIYKAVNLLINKRKRYIYAPDVSDGIARILAYRLKRFGLEFNFIQGGSSLYEDLINITSDDVLLVFSYSKILPEVSVLLEHSKVVNYDIIAFTDLIVSDFNNYSPVCLYNYRGEPSEYHSTVSSLAIVDCLVLKIAMSTDNSINKLSELNNVRSMYKDYIKR